MDLLTRLLLAVCVALVAILTVRLVPRYRRVHWTMALGIALCVACGMPLAATLLVNTGRAVITNLVSGLGGTVPKYMGIGTGATTFTATSTTLSTEVETRGTGTPTRTTTSTTNDTNTFVATITATAPRTITNMGFFDAVSTGNLFVGVDGLSIGLGTGDSLQGTLNASYA